MVSHQIFSLSDRTKEASALISSRVRLLLRILKLALGQTSFQLGLLVRLSSSLCLGSFMANNCLILVGITFVLLAGTFISYNDIPCGFQHVLEPDLIN
mmetsp:Transcript_14163/g.19261  ORF Transcript_14163/g.19261 Transcript_14163/m.19261 type:complete len:98 (-) Transcript_14163:124-417(-)